jgi:hypothetical protein
MKGNPTVRRVYVVLDFTVPGCNVYHEKNGDKKYIRPNTYGLPSPVTPSREPEGVRYSFENEPSGIDIAFGRTVPTPTILFDRKQDCHD